MVARVLLAHRRRSESLLDVVARHRRREELPVPAHLERDGRVGVVDLLDDGLGKLVIARIMELHESLERVLDIRGQGNSSGR